MSEAASAGLTQGSPAMGDKESASTSAEPLSTSEESQAPAGDGQKPSLPSEGSQAAGAPVKGPTVSHTEDPENLEELRFQVVDKDTGEVFRIDEWEQPQYTLFLSREELARKLATPRDSSADSDEDTPRMSSLKLGSLLGFGKKRDSGKVEVMEGHVKVSAVKKDSPDFPDLRLVQNLQAHEGPVWTMKFSHNGEYLASAGQSGVVVVWVVGAAAASSSASGAGVPVGDDARPGSDGVLRLLRLESHRRFTDHTKDVIDLSWNRENFLLSASIDKSVRLWHVARAECLHVFLHMDCVTSVDFHPKIEHLFVSGNFDKKLRIWNVTDGRVKEWANTPDMITAACFNPEGTMAVAGLYRGQVFFYQTEGMRYYTQVECRNRHGALKGGKKVTGLSYDTSRASPNASEQLLITTNDSRLRLYQTEDYSMLCKYKGLVNDHMQIKASFSEDGFHVISGSENGHVYIWRTTAAPSTGLRLDSLKKDRNAAYEMFPATDINGPNPPIISVALFAPSCAVAQAAKGTRFNLQASSCVNKMVVAADYSGRIRVYMRHALTKDAAANT